MNQVPAMVDPGTSHNIMTTDDPVATDNPVRDSRVELIEGPMTLNTDAAQDRESGEVNGSDFSIGAAARRLGFIAREVSPLDAVQ